MQGAQGFRREAYQQIGCNNEVPAQSRSELGPAKAGDFLRSPQIKNRRFQRLNRRFGYFPLIRFPPLGLPNRFKGSPRLSGVSQPVQLPQQI
jgi:hypothetical protein